LEIAAVLAQSRVREAIGPISAWLESGRTDVSPFTLGQIAHTLGVLVRPLPIESLGTPTLGTDVRADERALRLVVHALELALADKAPDVRQAAVEALAQVGGEQAAALAAAQVEDDDPRVRRAVASTLGALGDARSATTLAKLLADADVRTRLDAVQSTGKLRIQSAVPKLLEMLQDPDDLVRYIAVEALGDIRTAKAVPALLPLVRERHSVRDWRRATIPSSWLPLDCAAAQALRKIGDENAIAEARKVAPHCMTQP
jgi:HEAT repeat protein